MSREEGQERSEGKRQSKTLFREVFGGGEKRESRKSKKLINSDHSNAGARVSPGMGNSLQTCNKNHVLSPRNTHSPLSSLPTTRPTREARDIIRKRPNSRKNCRLSEKKKDEISSLMNYPDIVHVDVQPFGTVLCCCVQMLWATFITVVGHMLLRATAG